MVIVHHLADSRSQRILWLLEELGLPYEVRRYERDRRTLLAPPALAKVHPLGKSPAVEVDGRVLVESGAIAEYLVATAGDRLKPAGVEERLRYRQFLHYAEGSLMPPLLTMLVLRRLGLFGRPARPTIQRFIDRQLDWLDGELASRPWFAGSEFSAADIMMSFPLEAARARAGLDEKRVHLWDWLARIQARPAYQAALISGGPYRYAVVPKRA
jgi:glutathione S-transferase